MGYQFLQRDYDQLRQLAAKLDGRKTGALASIGSSSEQSSETWHDNPMFDEVHQQAKMWQSELVRVLAILREAEVVEPSNQTEVVGIGNHVRYHNVHTRRADEVIVGSYMHIGKAGDTIDGVDVATAGSPIGSALLGHKVGDIVVAKIKNNRGSVSRTLELEIIEISLP